MDTFFCKSDIFCKKNIIIFHLLIIVKRVIIKTVRFVFENAIEVLKLIEKHGFEAYIVGGYVRDIYLSKTSTDIDICTNAKPMDLVKIFKRNIIIDENYGSVKLEYKKSHFDITTFRKDFKYKNNRKPSKIEYVNDLEEDLYRRDFSINTMCMDKDGNIIDMFNAKKDIQSKTIRCIGDSNEKIEEDSLRILRAVRFACTLNFNIDKKLDKSIKKHIKLLENLSFHRKKSELNSIFRSNNYKYGLDLISKYKLDKYLEISKYKNIKKTSDVLGMWAQLDFSSNYPFSKLEMETIKKIREILVYGKIDSYILYKYGNCITLTVGEIFDIDKKEILDNYAKLPIFKKDDIKIGILDISSLLNMEPSKYIRDILDEIEYKIIKGELVNDKDILKKYVIEKYGDKNER